MNWKHLQPAPWLDTRAKFVAGIQPKGNLLDLGSSDGETLTHFAELRPDLNLFAVDLMDPSQQYPSGCRFHRANLETDVLPWPEASMDGITSMHLVEHLQSTDHLMAEIRRLLKKGGRAYIETPHPKTLALGSLSGPAAGMFTMNFYDDPTHTHIVPTGTLAQKARKCGLEVLASGTSRNWLFALSRFLPFPKSARQKATAQIHWVGWSAYLIVSNPL